MTNPTIILDIGQYSSKIGFAGADTPSQVFFTMAGKPKYHGLQAQLGGNAIQEIYVGDEIQSIGLYKIFYPMEKGRVIDWNLFEKIIDYVFYTLRVDPTMVNVLFAAHPMFPREDLERIFTLFLEHYQCMAFYPVIDSMLTLYSGGFNTGLVVEIGDSCTRIVPIYEGYKLDHAVRVLNIGGKDLTKYMEKILSSIGFTVDSSIRRDLVRVLKEKASFVSLDYKEDMNRYEEYSKQYSLPDGSTITLSKERFMVAEALFNPSLLSIEEDPLATAILDVIGLCDIDIRPKLLNNIFLSGGSSMFVNLKSRIYQELELELMKRKKKDQTIRIIAPRERTYSVWVGGSILATIPEFTSSWITRADYFNTGIPEHLL